MWFKLANSKPSHTGRGGKLKPTCPKPTQMDLETSLSKELSVEVKIEKYHFSCLAVRAFSLFDSLAVIVKYSTISNPSVMQTVQIVLQCSDSYDWQVDLSQVIIRDDSLFNNDLLPNTQYQCYKCVSSKPSNGPGSENTWNQSTWCLGMFCINDQ